MRLVSQRIQRSKLSDPSLWKVRQYSLIIFLLLFLQEDAQKNACQKAIDKRRYMLLCNNLRAIHQHSLKAPPSKQIFLLVAVHR
jgi:hypothetical protein